MLRPVVKILIAAQWAAVLGACAAPPPPPAPPPTVTLVATATLTATLVPTETTVPTGTAAATPTKPSATVTLRRVAPAPTGTPRPTAGPAPTGARSPTPGVAQLCADLMTKPAKVIYVLYVHPQPDLVWDTVEHHLVIGLCNTIPRSMGVPQGKYKVVFTFPLSSTVNSSSESKPVIAELAPGVNEVTTIWVPGYENHVTRCAPKSLAYAQIQYNDTPDPYYHALLYPDGSDHVEIHIQCGGNYALGSRIF